MPIAEIATFIKVGNLIGLWPTIATVILTAIIGAAMIRHQGWRALADAQRASNEGRLPIDAVVAGVFLLVAALMLLTPGFITDAFGFLLLWQPLRLSLAKWLWVRIKSSVNVQMYPGADPFAHPRPHAPGPAPKMGGPIIEGKINRVDDDNLQADDQKTDTDEPNTKSPWNKGHQDNHG